MRHSRGLRRIAGSALFIAMGWPLPFAEAQDLGPLISACGGASEVQLAWCQEVALAAQAAQGALGLAASGGMDVPGSASTLGWRTKGSPRFALSLWGSLTRAPIPSLSSVGGLPQGESKADFPSVHLSGTVGVFDGFSIRPTVGGFGSVDLVVSTQWIHAPTDEGFQENDVGWGMGARIGILRESFTLPGITVSAFYRSLGSQQIWNLDEGDPAQAVFDLGVTSFRGQVGKDLWGIGLFGGAGWDRNAGTTTLGVAEQDVGSGPSSASGEIQSDRYLFFAGGSMTFLTLQVSLEGGWAQGFNPLLPSPSGETFDPSSGSEFGALSLRLTF